MIFAAMPDVCPGKAKVANLNLVFFSHFNISNPVFAGETPHLRLICLHPVGYRTSNVTEGIFREAGNLLKVWRIDAAGLAPSLFGSIVWLNSRSLAGINSTKLKF
jgi:hypothetical protein